MAEGAGTCATEAGVARPVAEGHARGRRPTASLSRTPVPAPRPDAARRARARRPRHGCASTSRSTSPPSRATTPCDPSFMDRVKSRIRRRQRKIRRRVSRALVSVFRLTSRGRRGRVLFVSRLSPTLVGNLKIVHDRMVERGPGHATTTSSRSSRRTSPRRSAWLDRLRLLSGLATARRDLPRRQLRPRLLDRLPARGAGSSSCGTRRARSRPSATAGPASARRTPRCSSTPTAGSTRTTPHVIVSSEFDVPFYAEALGRPREPRRSRPASRAWTGSSSPRRRPSAVAEAEATFPIIKGRDGLAVRARRTAARRPWPPPTSTTT